MNPQTRVGVLHAPLGAANLIDIKRAARNLCQVVLILPAEVAQANPQLCDIAAELFEVAVIPADRLADEVGSLNVAGLTTFHDSWLECTDNAIAAAGLPGAAAANPWDKLVQRERLGRHGLTRIRAAAVDSVDDFTRQLAQIGLPCVLKPRRAAGGAGVAFIESESDAEFQIAQRKQWSALLLESRLASGNHPAGGYLADFVSVETVNTGDQHLQVATFDKFPVQILRRAGEDGADAVTETGDVTPTRLPDAQTEQLHEYVRNCLEALEIRWRVTHTEVRITPYGPEIIEVNGRVGGYVNGLLRRLKGPDLVAAALSLATGEVPAVAGLQRPGFAIAYLPAFPTRASRVKSMVTPEDLRTLPGVVGVEEVASHGSPLADTGYRMANLTLVAATVEDLGQVLDSCHIGVSKLYAADMELS